MDGELAVFSGTIDRLTLLEDVEQIKNANRFMKGDLSYLGYQTSRVLNNRYAQIVLGNNLYQVDTTGSELVDRWMRWDEDNQYYKWLVRIKIPQRKMDNKKLLD